MKKLSGLLELHKDTHELIQVVNISLIHFKFSNVSF